MNDSWKIVGYGSPVPAHVLREMEGPKSLQLGPNEDPGQYGEWNGRPFPLLKEGEDR